MSTPPSPPSHPTDSVAVVLVPLPSQGHLNQFLHLALTLAARGLPVHYAAPAPHLSKTQSRASALPLALLRLVHFHPLHMAPFSSPLPDPASFYPFHLLPLFEALNTAAEPLRDLLATLAADHRRVAVVYDNTCRYAALEASHFDNVEAFALCCGPASFLVGWFDPAALAVATSRSSAVFPPPEDCIPHEVVRVLTRSTSPEQPVVPEGMLVNTCRPVESEFIDAAELLPGVKKLFAVGPMHPVVPLMADDEKPKHESLVWLDKQPPESVLYVSFGSTTTMTLSQIRELAAGIASSGQRFIWVVRDADRADMSGNAAEDAVVRYGDVTAELEKECEGRGKVIRGWAPQLEILAHGATAAFMSHCGWNSMLESLSYGVQVLTWPMHSDQPWNAALVCKHLRAGLPARPWERRKEVMKAGEIEAVIRRAMVGEDGAEVRKRARALGADIRRAVTDGGSSRAELEAFVAHIKR